DRLARPRFMGTRMMLCPPSAGSQTRASCPNQDPEMKKPTQDTGGFAWLPGAASDQSRHRFIAPYSAGIFYFSLSSFAKITIFGGYSLPRKGDTPPRERRP